MTDVVDIGLGDAASLPQPDVDELVRATVQWHFGAETGSPYWLDRARTLDFDPLSDVTSAADLQRFPDVSPEWRALEADALIPRGGQREGRVFSVFESGGTSGPPKRIVDGGSRRQALRWVSTVLDRHGLRAGGDGHWLHIGPSGPHLVGRSVGDLARMGRALCHYVDLDPRWVRRCMAERRHDEANSYMSHVVDQVTAVLETQPVTTVLATPVLLGAIAAHPRTLELLQARLRFLLWTGTSLSAEGLRVLEDELFPDCTVIGLYGNTMMGIAPQRPAVASDAERCVFQSHHPYCLLDVVVPDSPHQLAAYGDVGQVTFSLLTRDLFLPNCRERDSAVRVPPTAEFDWTGVARVAPLAGPQPVIEGVY